MSIDHVVTDANNGEPFGRHSCAETNLYTKIDPDGRDVEIVIKRDTCTEKSVTSTILVSSTVNPDSKFSVYALEAAKAGDNGDKKPIKEGTYDAKTRTDRDPQRFELQDVDGYKSIQIHNGNGPKDVKGCFIVGAGRSKDKVSGNVDALGRINNIVKADGGSIQVRVEGASTRPWKEE